MTCFVCCFVKYFDTQIIFPYFQAQYRVLYNDRRQMKPDSPPGMSKEDLVDEVKENTKSFDLCWQDTHVQNKYKGKIKPLAVKHSHENGS